MDHENTKEHEITKREGLDHEGAKEHEITKREGLDHEGAKEHEITKREVREGHALDTGRGFSRSSRFAIVVPFAPS